MASAKWERRRSKRPDKSSSEQLTDEGQVVTEWRPKKVSKTSPEARRRRRRRGMSLSTERKQIRNRHKATPPNYKHGQRPAGRRRRPIKRPMTPR